LVVVYYLSPNVTEGLKFGVWTNAEVRNLEYAVMAELSGQGLANPGYYPSMELSWAWPLVG
jgi:hypothetical protein